MAFARDVLKKPFIVTPAKAGAQVIRKFCMPACAGQAVLQVPLGSLLLNISYPSCAQSL